MGDAADPVRPGADLQRLAAYRSGDRRRRPGRLPPDRPSGDSPAGGTIFVAAGIGIFAIAFWRYRDGYRELREQGFRIPPLWAMGLLIAILILSSLAALVLVFSSDSGP